MNEADRNRAARLADVLRDMFLGDREKLILRSELSKGRISQLLSGKEAFGERAARKLEKKIGLRKMYLDERSGPGSVSEPGNRYSDVTKVIQSELAQGDAYDMIHRALKALHIIDNDEAEILQIIRDRSVRMAKLIEHLDEIRVAEKRESARE